MDVILAATVIRQFGDRRPLVELYKDVVDLAVEAERLGFDGIWLSEHHFQDNQWCPSLLPILGAIAARTSTLRLGTNLLVAPYHHPIRLAEDVATVDLLSNGRLDLILGTGSIRREFDTFAIAPNERWGRTFETLEVLQRSFSEEEFDHEGRYFQFPGLRMTTKPVQDPMPLWMAAAGPKTITRAGGAGHHYATPTWTKTAEHWEIYATAVQEAGHDPSTRNFATFTGGVVAPTWTNEQDASFSAAVEGLMAFYASQETVFAGTGYDVMADHPFANSLCGTPDDVLAMAEKHLAGSQVTHFALSHLGPLESLQLFAREVLPTIRTWGRAPVRSII